MDSRSIYIMEDTGRMHEPGSFIRVSCIIQWRTRGACVEYRRTVYSTNDDLEQAIEWVAFLFWCHGVTFTEG